MDYEPLNEREQKLARLLCFDLMQHKQIAKELGVATRTINGYIGIIKDKLGIEGRFDKGAAKKILIEHYGFKP